MQYMSTRGGGSPVSAEQAIVRGLAPDGGLYVPEAFPRFSADEISRFLSLDYPALAATVLAPWLPGFAYDELLGMCGRAYSRFAAPDVVPVHAIGGERYILELYHGPTHAFKDVALQLLPHLLRASKEKISDQSETLILVATSGDTGKAALEGFAGQDGVRITVFYPEGGVSEVQKLQMATQEGENTRVVAVRGNFDDAQTGVKRIFSDPEIEAALAARGICLSSANSINLGRLVPQIAYYFAAYADLVRRGTLLMGEKVNICVPTGNFGNILAAYYAREMGLPADKFICASNSNNVLADFIQTGVYDLDRDFRLTTSPSMDILLSSNLERMLFELAGRDAQAVAKWMVELKADGRYDIGADALNRLNALMAGGWASEEDVQDAIRRVWEEDQYLIDPHTAVAIAVLDQYRAKTHDQTPAIIAATASPYKFGGAVLAALGGDMPDGEFARLAALADRTRQSVPESIRSLKEKEILHTTVCDIAEMANQII